MATSNGQFWGVLNDPANPSVRPFRDTGISILEPVPAGAPPGVTRWSGNPSLLLIDSTARGGPALDVSANSTITDVVGIVDYHESALGYTAILLNPNAGYGTVDPGGSAAGTPATAPTPVQSTIATLDLDKFYDTSVVDATGFTNRIDKTGLAAVHFLNSPDILGVQQVQSLEALKALASQIAADGGPTYTPCWFAGNDQTGLSNGYLVNETRVTVKSCAQVDAGKTFRAPDGSSHKLFDRPPVVLVAGLHRGAIADYPITVVNSEFLDRTNIDDSKLGSTVRAQRAAQAEDLSAIVQGYQSTRQHVIALGDYHSFEFSDGYVDTIGAVTGNPVAASLVTTPASSVTRPSLVNLGTQAANRDRYTFVENGSAEDTDHILVTSDLPSLASTSYARFGADFPVADLNDNTTALHASSHDGLVAYLTLPQGAQFTLVSSLNPSGYEQDVTFTATAAGATGTPTGTVTFYDGTVTLCNAQATIGGAATCSTSALSVGQHNIKATYSGDTIYAPASAHLTQTVKPQAPQFSLISSVNPSIYAQTVTFTATASGSIGTPTGTIVFSDGSTILCASEALTGGQGTCSTKTLSIGQHTISAVYSGDSAYAPATATLLQTVAPDPVFSMRINPSNASLYTGEAATYIISIIPEKNFLLDVALSCSAPPPAATCTFSPAIVTGGQGAAKLVLQTSPPVNTKAMADGPTHGKGLPFLACFIVFLLPRRLRRRGIWIVAALLLPLVSEFMSACGGSGTLTGGTPPATYTITVTGKAIGSPAPVVETATTTLKVNSLF